MIDRFRCHTGTVDDAIFYTALPPLVHGIPHFFHRDGLAVSRRVPAPSRSSPWMCLLAARCFEAGYRRRQGVYKGSEGIGQRLDAPLARES